MTALYLYLWQLPDGSILGRAGAWTERPKFEPMESGRWVRYSAVRDDEGES